MKPGDFVDVHLDSGCLIGKLLSIDDNGTMTVKLANNIVVEEIPREKVTPWVSV